jgi:two-component system CheB/CheR fusion protein
MESQTPDRPAADQPEELPAPGIQPDLAQPATDSNLGADGDQDSNLRIVGLGASAGGLNALQEFFSNMSPDSGMAFVVILHLSPNFQSNAATVIQQSTSMTVTQVTATEPLVPNHVYVIPPANYLSITDGHLRLTTDERGAGRRAPIDLFFRALAETHGRNAAAIVLSGTGADGAIGVQRIKEQGGVVLVQDPDEAQFDAMPRNAIATGLVDFVIPVAAMPAQLIEYWRNAEEVRLPPADMPRSQDDTEALREIFVLLRTRTGHDFSQYKRATLLRRIGRRMQVNNVTDLPGYLRALRGQPDEVQALLRDLLISVTNFFRDQQAWEALEAIVPTLLADKTANDQLRVWVAGCATGEEAYSVAILLYEAASTLAQPPTIQIFATDIDEEAINQARQGIYPDTIAADVSAERLQRFFVAEQGRYRIKKEIRDLVLFAPHNLLRDPPFSKLDLITCRNLLIYLNREVQQQVLDLFHFVLRSSGFLLLGASESTDGVPSLFSPIDKAQRLFQRRTVPASAPPLVPSLPLYGPPRTPGVASRATNESNTPSFTELDLQSLAHYGPPRVIVNDEYEIVHLARGAGRFLQLADGELSPNLLKLVHPDLRLELRTALFAAVQKGEPTETRRMRLEIEGAQRLVSVMVHPILEPAWGRGYILVMFGDMPDGGDVTLGAAADVEPLVRQLEAELQRTKEQLRTTIEPYETAVEEYKAANEELQAINEELRAATEELETSKEELQSVNEELTTVNQELKHKVEEVSQSNNDLQNLMASTEIGTIFIDRELRIKRYTPSTQAIFNLIPTDINRPIMHITHKLGYDQLHEDAARVLATLTQVEREVPSDDGHWYLVRLLPYRTVEDKIDGVILTFVDITSRKQVEAALRQARDELELRGVERTRELADTKVLLRDEGTERLRAEVARREALRRLVTAQEEERKRIARELHDQLGQLLSALRLDLNNLSQVSQPAQQSGVLGRLQQTAAELDSQLDRLALELRPVVLDDLGLRPALQQHVEDWSARNGIAAEFQTTGDATAPLPPEVDIVLYRVVQEALANVMKHAQAQHVSVILDQRPSYVHAIVEDNGQGFDVEATQQMLQGRLGLLGIEERAAMVGGTVTGESAPGHGTPVYIRIALDQKTGEGAE